MTVSVDRSRPRAAWRAGSFWLLSLLSVACGGAVVLAGVIAPGSQPGLVFGVPVLLFAVAAFIWQPHVGVAAYLVLLPLAMPAISVAGMNPGELLTAAFLVLGFGTLSRTHASLAEAWIRLRPLLWPLIGLSLVAVASALVNELFSLTEIVSAVFKMLAFAFAAILVYMHADTPAKADRMLLAIVIGGAAVAAYSIVAYVLGWSYSEAYEYNRASGTFEHWNHLGGYMALLSMPTLAMAVRMRSGPTRMLLGIVFAAEIVALLLSLTLGSVFALIGAILLVAPFLFRVGWRRIVPAALLLGVSFVVVLLTDPLLAEKFTRVDERVIDRLKTYSVGAAMMRDRLWFGFGSQSSVLDALQFGAADYGITSFGVVSTVPHNSLISMGVEKGIFGLLLFGMLLVGCVRILVRWHGAFRDSGQYALYQGLAVGIVAFLIQNMTNNLVLHARIGIVFFALLALLVRLGALGAVAPPKSAAVSTPAPSAGDTGG